MGLFRAKRDKSDTWDRPLDYHDKTSMMVLTTLCVSRKNVHITNTTQTHKEKCSKSLEQDFMKENEINMPKDHRWLIKKKWCKDSKRVH